MKKFTTILLLCLITCLSWAQINVSTGVDNAGLPLTPGSTDPNWVIASSPYPGINPAIVVPSYAPFWQATPVKDCNARWLNKSSVVSNETPGLYVFERKLPNLTPGCSFTYNISVAWDDTLQSLELVSPFATIPLTVIPTSAYNLSVPATGTVSGPGPWTIRAKVAYIDQLGGFMLCGNVKKLCDSTVYCCPGPNLVRNGNFESGNAFFGSQYSFQPSLTANGVLPGQYNVVNSSQALGISPQWLADDHTKCINGTNSRFMVVNGRTTQPLNTTRIIWQQTVSVTPNKQYKLCVNLKNMPQCSFDVLPRVRLEVNGQFTPWTTISTAAGLCNWQLLDLCFTANAQQAQVRIHLREDGQGDGNDLAIDDISVQEKQNPNLSITVQHQGNPKQVVGSLNSLSNSDDVLQNDICKLQNRYYWFVYEVGSFPALTIAPNSFAWASNTGGFNTQLPGTAIPAGAWGLTTTFPGYTFASNKLYLVGLYVPSCCQSCLTDGFTYQLIANFGSRMPAVNARPELTDAQKEEIKALFVKGQMLQAPDAGNQVFLFPNPAKDMLSISADLDISTIQVISSSGVIQMEEKGAKIRQLNIARLAAGIYTLKIGFVNGETTVEKFIKE